MVKRIISSLSQLIKRPPQKLGLYAGILVGVSALIFVFWPNAYIDGVLKDRLTRVLEEAYPGYSIDIGGLQYRILPNRLECDSVSVMKGDSTISCSVTKLSVSGMDRIQLLWGGGVALKNLGSSRADAEGVTLTLVRSQYELRCARLRISVPDSVLDLEMLQFRPPGEDEHFFAASRFRRTRFRLDIPQCRVTGLAWLELLQGKNYRARAAHAYDVSLAVLVNKDKPVNEKTPGPRMPNAVLLSIKEPLHIDSIKVTNGRLVYGERFGVGMDPAVLTCDSLQVLAAGVGNTAGGADTAVIRAQGTLMNTGAMNVHMSVPAASPELTFGYSGVLSRMRLSAFNPFLELSEQKRLKTGILHSAAFDIDVTDGKATGIARAAYEDLKIVAIDDHSGSESGVINTVASVIANNVKLRTSNMPDNAGNMKIGKVKYAKKRDETFLEFAWFALRGGLGDVVGF